MKLTQRIEDPAIRRQLEAMIKEFNSSIVTPKYGSGTFNEATVNLSPLEFEVAQPGGIISIEWSAYYTNLNNGGERGLRFALDIPNVDPAKEERIQTTNTADKVSITNFASYEVRPGKHKFTIMVTKPPSGTADIQYNWKIALN